MKLEFERIDKSVLYKESEFASYYFEAFTVFFASILLLLFKPQLGFWSLLLIGHGIMSFGRCYLKPEFHFKNSKIGERKLQFLARYINEYGSWVGILCIIFCFFLNFNGKHLNILETDETLSLLLFLNLIIPALIIIPLLLFRTKKGYAQIRNLRTLFMFPLSLIMLIDSIVFIAALEFSFTSILIWAICALQLLLILMAFNYRWAKRKNKRLGKTQSVIQWRAGVCAFILIHIMVKVTLY